MDTHHDNFIERPDNQATVLSNSIGYLLSVLLTAAAAGAVFYYASIHQGTYSHALLIAGVVAFAIVQLIVQLVFFLGLNRRSSSRWNLTVFMFMIIILFIVAAGSLWIMNNLNYNMMPAQINAYMLHQAESNSL